MRYSRFSTRLGAAAAAGLLPTVAAAQTPADTFGVAVVAQETACPARLPRPADVDALESATVDRPPQVREQPTPQVPGNLETGSGSAVFRFVIDTTGRVDPCHIYLVERTDAAWVPAAHVTLLRSLFRPARHEGQLVRVWAKQRISYDVVR